MWALTGHVAYSLRLRALAARLRLVPVPRRVPAPRARHDRGAVPLEGHRLSPLADHASSPRRAGSSGSRGRARCSGASRCGGIPNGIDLDDVPPRPRGEARQGARARPERPVVLFSSLERNDRRKGGDVARRCAVLARRPRLPARRARAGGERLRARRSRALGTVRDDERLALAYAAADVFVLPALAENLPNVAVESIACGTPVVRLGGRRDPRRRSRRRDGLLVAARRRDRARGGDPAPARRRRAPRAARRAGAFRRRGRVRRRARGARVRGALRRAARERSRARVKVSHRHAVVQPGAVPRGDDRVGARAGLSGDRVRRRRRRLDGRQPRRSSRRYEDRLHVVDAQENAGQVAAINSGFERTSGELMAYVNSDDTLLPGAVSEMVAELEADPALVMVYGDALYTDADSNRTGYLTSREWDPPAMVRNCDNHVVQPSSMWTRAAWEHAGPFDERGYYFFDFELYLRLSRARSRETRAAAVVDLPRAPGVEVGRRPDRQGARLPAFRRRVPDRRPAAGGAAAVRARGSRARARRCGEQPLRPARARPRAALAVGGARHRPAERVAAVALARGQEPASEIASSAACGRGAVPRIGVDATSVSRDGKGHARSQRRLVEALAALGRYDVVAYVRTHGGGGSPPRRRDGRARAGKGRRAGSRSACGARCAGSTRSSRSATGCRSVRKGALSSGSSSSPTHRIAENRRRGAGAYQRGSDLLTAALWRRSLARAARVVAGSRATAAELGGDVPVVYPRRRRRLRARPRSRGEVRLPPLVLRPARQHRDRARGLRAGRDRRRAARRRRARRPRAGAARARGRAGPLPRPRVRRGARRALPRRARVRRRDAVRGLRVPARRGARLRRAGRGEQPLLDPGGRRRGRAALRSASMPRRSRRRCDACSPRTGSPSDLRRRGFEQAGRFTWERTAEGFAAVIDDVLA